MIELELAVQINTQAFTADIQAAQQKQGKLGNACVVCWYGWEADLERERKCGEGRDSRERGAGNERADLIVTRVEKKSSNEGRAKGE